MKKCRVLRITIILLLFSFITVNATEVTIGKTIWYVHPDSTLNSIQAALDSCSSNDIVLVAPGTYVENIIWPDTNGIHLISELGPELTIIDGDSAGSVISINTWIDSTTIIRGFTIRKGYALEGGGILCNHYASPIISENIITMNVASGRGGGIFCYEAGYPIITNNTINYNTSSVGGGIDCTDCWGPTISNNIIAGNTATHGGGGIECYFGSVPIINNNLIIENIGGGIDCHQDSPTIVDNIIKRNIGVGICCGWEASPIITKNIIEENSIGIFISDYCSPIIDSCTISDNNGDGIQCSYAWPPGTSNPIINYCNIINNNGYGVSNDVPYNIINAQYNWWGDASGPYHSDSNPGGLGDTVSSYVDFIPWLTEPSGIEDDETDKEIFFISHGYPNPFMDKTKIEYNLPIISNVNISVYNVLGARVKTLLNKRQNAGIYSITWDGRDERGNKLPSGFYFLRLEAGEYEGTRKLLLIR